MVSLDAVAIFEQTSEGMQVGMPTPCNCVSDFDYSSLGEPEEVSQWRPFPLSEVIPPCDPLGEDLPILTTHQATLVAGGPQSARPTDAPFLMGSS